MLACKYRLPEGFPPVAAELVTALLVLPPTERLGGAAAEGAAARHGRIRNHAFFAGVQGAADARTLHTAPLPLPSLQELCLPIVSAALHTGGWHRAALRGAPSESWPEPVRRQSLTPLTPLTAARLRPPPPPSPSTPTPSPLPSPSPCTLALRPRPAPSLCALALRPRPAPSLCALALRPRAPPSAEQVRLRLAFELHRKQQLTSELRVALALGPEPPPILDDIEEYGAVGEDEEGDTHGHDDKEGDGNSAVDYSEGIEV